MAGSIESVMGALYDDLETNVARVSGRRELIEAVDIVYHSPCAFSFQGRMINKGAMELLVIGDTRTGKTSTITEIMNHFRCGDFISGDSVTMAGLLAGVDEGARGRFVRSGRLPLNHRGLITIDEANELDPELVGKMSSVRSSGVLDIVKISSVRLNCIVRQIWIANTKGDKTLAQYPYGIEAVMDLIDKPEDVARFDMVIGYSESDVDREALFRPSREWSKLPHRYNSECCHSIVRWAWSRKVDDIVISDETEDAILEVAEALSGEYDPSIPIMIPAESRIKVAKGAVAVAARCYSTDQQREKVIVRPEHATYYGDAFRRIHSVPSIRFDAWTRKEFAGSADQQENVEKIIYALGTQGCEALLAQKYVSARRLMEIFGNREHGERAFQLMTLARVIRKSKRNAYLSSDFVNQVRAEFERGSLGDVPSGHSLMTSDKGNDWLNSRPREEGLF